MVNFYSMPHAAELQAPLNAYLKDSKKNDKNVILWSDMAEVAFGKIKTSLVEATLLVHPRDDPETRIVTDASDFAQGLGNPWLSFRRSFPRPN